MQTASDRDRRNRFEDSEALRALLNRLHQAGRGAWQRDPEAAALMEHAANKYAARPQARPRPVGGGFGGVRGDAGNCDAAGG